VKGSHVNRFAAGSLVLAFCLASSLVAAAAEKEAGGESLEEVIIRGARPTEAGPLPGLLIGRDQIPGNIQSAGREQIENSGALSLGDFMNSQLQGVSVNDYSGNPFKMDVNYRGFTASPEIGTPVGLSVFFDGVRVNEPFGDVVNWDLLPLIAIERFDLFPGSNPLFGLNTLGGALSLRSRSGFTSPGYEGEISTGSWNRRQVQASAGVNNGTFGGFAAVQYFDEDGWRDDSPSDVRQLFLRGDWRGTGATAFVSALLADNELIGNGLIPTDLYQVRRQSVFTSPDETRNRLSQFTLSGTQDVSDAWSITAQVYRRDSERTGVNGDIYEGFDDFTTERDLARTGLQRVNPNLPWCQVANLNGGGTPQGDNPILNGPAGINCSIGNYTSQIPRNGGSRGASSTPNDPPSLTGTGPGVVEGTPIGLLSKIRLEQVTDGAALQSNWNLAQHRFMVGASIDRSRSSYELRQRLGLIDANHRVYEDPDAIDPIYRAAQVDIVGNKFDGTSRTSSLYFSETWSPRQNVHVTASARYNHAVVDSRLLTRTAEGSSRLDQIRNRNVVFPVYVVCPTIDPASCPDEPQPVVFDFNGNAANQTLTTDRFQYNSFNPQLGINWLPVPELNLFGNVSRGARVPSVVELGCAFDDTPVPIVIGPEDDPVQIGSRPRSLIGPTCNLPTTLSGDPFLPQIHSTSVELGARGRLWKRWRWNASAYRTDLRDDLYFVGVADGRSYFDTIGKTRRLGFEAGFAGEIGRFDIAVGYSFVDATFQSTFYAASPHNSRADFDQNSIPAWDLILGQSLLPSATANENRGYGTYRMIRIDPGARLPGIPAHNGNATLTWRPTDAWRVSLTMIAHSLSYVRGNENNQHQTGGTDQEIGLYVCQYALCEQNLTRAGRPFTEDGKTGGFAVFNLNASYQIAKQLTVFAQVNNVFDRDYLTAGRLGITPFSPSTYGAIGPSGWNYNSSEWQNSTFVGPGAPRGAWIGLRYQHDVQ
jgi:outer membrane receptor protein involved in Fe transport